ncbi:DUF2975 domain-containing protein [bacterium]|nr:MAG: DUF2975 domain-containing protein [bacterium]
MDIRKRLHNMNSSTTVLRLALMCIGLFILGVCIFVLPRELYLELTTDFDYGFLFLIMYVTTLPFYFALYSIARLLTYVDKKMIFTRASVKAIRHVKLCAYSISAVYALGMPYIFTLGDADDAPGIVLLGFMVVLSSFIIATVAGIVQKLVEDALLIKTENDLTV